MLRNNPKDPQQAAIKIQSTFRGFFSRTKTNLYGQSEGKEIEIYLPWGIKKIDSEDCSYEMFGGRASSVCECDLFSVKMDDMNFEGCSDSLSIIEIVTAPFRKPDERRTNLFTEQEIDAAVSDFIALLEDFTQVAASQSAKKTFIRLNELISLYNKTHTKHPLRVDVELRRYLENPMRKKLFRPEYFPVKKHQNIEIGFIYEPAREPIFDKSSTPRTVDAADLISRKAYKEGKLLIHIQKTFSMPIEKYKPGICKEPFHNTAQQLNYLQVARQRAELFISNNPLPPNAHREKILGLLTVCTEHIISVSHAAIYEGLHEKADRPVLSIRHILHYLKKNICNETECQWFDEMYKHRSRDIQSILCENNYTPDYKGNHNEYGNAMGLSQHHRYDVIFDLFGDFKNGCDLPENDEDYRLSDAEFQLLNYGISSWKVLFENHMSISGRNHFRLQKVINEQGKTEYHPLFEARRLGLMTADEFKKGKSRVSLDSITSQPRHTAIPNKLTP